MPDHLVLVRHGESDGNVAQELSKKGDESLFTESFRNRAGRKWHLTSKGIEQAQAAGKWISTNISETFDRYYVSPYVRTRETAAHLNLPDPTWLINRRVRERDWGDIGSLPRSEQDLTKENTHIRNIDWLYWRPPSGESLVDVQIRVRLLFDTLHRECAEKKVIIVSHGEFINACRAELEYMNDEEWEAMNDDKEQKIYNTQTLHYTRINPETHERAAKLQWFQNVCPWADSPDEQWHSIERATYSNSGLLESIDD